METVDTVDNPVGKVDKVALHIKKVWPEPFKAVITGAKHAEFRDIRDWPILPLVGDVLRLNEWDPKTCDYTEGWVSLEITHIQTGFGIPDGFAMLSFDVNIYEDVSSAPEEKG